MFKQVHTAHRRLRPGLPTIAPALIAAACTLSAAPAQATTVTPLIAVVGLVDASCAQAMAMAPAASSMVADATLTKSEAILGGATSALDRIRAQQAGLTAGAAVVPAAQTVSARAASETPVTANAVCATASLALPARVIEPAALTQPAVPAIRLRGNPRNFLATSRVAIRRTTFTAQWDRVSGADLSPSRVRRLVGNLPADDAATLQTVNRWVNQSIAYQEDRSLWSRRDYWATAAETLRAGSGDCEDLAILKYQMLRASGVPARDMYLTLARDLVRNADHAVLVVRNGDRWYMLDNATDAILPADRSYDYRPTLSFNSESAWLHGTTVLAERAQPDYLSVSAMLMPRVIGLSR